MKFLPIALLAAVATAETVIEYTGAATATSSDKSSAAPTSASGSSSSSECEAEYIVERCLTTEKAKVDACDPTDYGCLCAAYEAIATCYNNCPNDARAPPANNQVQIYCQQASLQASTKTTAKKSDQTSSADSDSDASATTTSTEAGPTNTDSIKGGTDDSGDDEGAAGSVLVNTGGLLVAIAGAAVAMF